MNKKGYEQIVAGIFGVIFLLIVLGVITDSLGFQKTKQENEMLKEENNKITEYNSNIHNSYLSEKELKEEYRDKNIILNKDLSEYKNKNKLLNNQNNEWREYNKTLHNEIKELNNYNYKLNEIISNYEKQDTHIYYEIFNIIVKKNIIIYTSISLTFSISFLILFKLNLFNIRFIIISNLSPNTRKKIDNIVNLTHKFHDNINKRIELWKLIGSIIGVLGICIVMIYGIINFLSLL